MAASFREPLPQGVERVPGLHALPEKQAMGNGDIQTSERREAGNGRLWLRPVAVTTFEGHGRGD